MNTTKGNLSDEKSSEPAYTTVVAPATPLPWTCSPDGDDAFCIEQLIEPDGDIATVYDKTNTSYIVHAANAYPKLVAALHDMIDADHRTDPERLVHVETDLAEALLRKLGEPK